MNIDDLLAMAPTGLPHSATYIAAWNALEDEVAKLSYYRLNEISDYLPEWASAADLGSPHSVLLSMVEDRIEEIEEEEIRL
jgi:hypothetical protein